MLFYQLRDDDKKRVFSTKPFTAQEKTLLQGVHPEVAAGLE